MPNFLIIGAAKSGTTALHTYLQQHPQIYMTPSKETNFFAFEGQEIDFKGPGDEALKEFSITNLDTYQQQFKNVTNELAIGEACPLYLYHAEAAKRIKNYIPNARLIIILRNPIERAYANFLHLIRDGREPVTDFSQALENETRRINENWEWFWHYTQVGYYGEQIKNYTQLFSPEQIKIYLYEDLKSDPLSLFQDIFSFLEVDPSFQPDLTIRPNKSGMPKNKLLHKILTQPNPLKAALKPLIPAAIRQKIQHQNLAKPNLLPDAKQQLISLYQADILHCQNLINRDLSSWLNYQV